MKLKVKLFGPQAQIANRRDLELEFEDANPSIAQVREALGRSAPALLDSLSGSRLAVNHEFAAEDEKVQIGDEIALIGLISGG